MPPSLRRSMAFCDEDFTPKDAPAHTPAVRDRPHSARRETKVVADQRARSRLATDCLRLDYENLEAFGRRIHCRCKPAGPAPTTAMSGVPIASTPAFTPSASAISMAVG